MHNTESFWKLYSEKERFSLYNVSVYVSQQSIPNDVEFNILSITEKEEKETFNEPCDIFPGNAIFLIATSSAFKYSTCEDKKERTTSVIKNKLS